ncbi:MAG: hypothetical protein HKN80_05195 [Acidimicrobiia bacterium]|nr:hypothetical protein [Acidimicrobiia bacterium]
MRRIAAALAATVALVGLVYVLAAPDMRPVPFVMAQPPAPDATSIDLLFNIGCMAYASAFQAQVEETPEVVTISVAEETGEFCTSMLIFADTTVHLDAPFGDRRVVDAVDGLDVAIADAEYMRSRPPRSG